MAKEKNNILTNLANLFGIRADNKKKGTFVPVAKDSKGNYNALENDNSTTRMLNYICDNMNISNYRANEHRFERYKDMEYMIQVEPLLNTALKVYVREAYSPQVGKKAIECHANKSKIEDDFYQWFVDVGYNDSVIRDIIAHLVVDGDSFQLNGINSQNLKEGIVSITSIEPTSVINRMEYNVSLVNEMKKWYSCAYNLSNNYQSLKDIWMQLQNGECVDYTEYYKSRLLGFELETCDDNRKSMGLPPWAITHYRNFTTDKAFFPFGKPVLFNALPAFKSYRTTEMLLDMLRVASFPREIYKIKCDEGADTFSRQERVNEVSNFIANTMPQNDGDDELQGVGRPIYTMDDLFEYDVINPNVDLDQLGNYEQKRTDMITATGIPDSYLNPSEGAGSLGGENAEALKYLNKIFSKTIAEIQESLCEGIANTYRLHLEMTGKFDGAQTDFELSVVNPIDDYNSDKVELDSDVFSFAKDIIDTLASITNIDTDDIPQSVIKDIMKTYLPVNSGKVNKWISAFYKNAEESQAQDTVESDDTNKENDSIFGKGGKGNLLHSKPVHESKKINEKLLLEAVKSDKLHEEYMKLRKKSGNLIGSFGNCTFVNNTIATKRNYKDSMFELISKEVMNKDIKKIQESINISALEEDDD